MNVADMAMVRMSGRSWWSVDYAIRSVHEWDTAPGRIRTPLTIDSRRSLWEELTKVGIRRALLCCPDGHVGAVEQPQDGRLFQFKIGSVEFGMGGPVGGRQSWCDAHVLGIVTNPEGDCECWAWEPRNWRLIHFHDSIWDFQYRKLGRLAVTETLQLRGVG